MRKAINPYKGIGAHYQSINDALERIALADGKAREMADYRHSSDFAELREAAMLARLALEKLNAG